MLIDIRYIHAEISQVQLDFARRQIEPAVQPFAAHVERTLICLEGVSGPQGGAHTRCSITVELGPTLSEAEVVSHVDAVFTIATEFF